MVVSLTCVRRPVARAAVGAVAALVVVLAALAYVVWERSRTTQLSHAVATAPANSERLSWTDWAGVRREVGGNVDRDSDRAGVTAFLDEAFEADLSSRSALLESAGPLQE